MFVFVLVSITTVLSSVVFATTQFKEIVSHYVFKLLLCIQTFIMYSNFYYVFKLLLCNDGTTRHKLVLSNLHYKTDVS